MLSEQLRRFLDDQVWLENRRVMEILRSIETRALVLRDHPPEVDLTLPGVSPKVALPMERPLYRPPDKVTVRSDGITVADEQIDTSLLHDQVYVDREQLVAAVRRALRATGQVDLTQLVAEAPLVHGLAELIGYLALSEPDIRLVFDEKARDQVRWRDEKGRTRAATVPRVTFVREAR